MAVPFRSVAASYVASVAAFVEPTKAMARNLFAFRHFFISLSSSPLPQPAAAFYDPPSLLSWPGLEAADDGWTDDRTNEEDSSIRGIKVLEGFLTMTRV